MDRAELASGAAVVRQAFCGGLRPEKRLTVSEWADTHRILSKKSSDEPGQYRTDRMPYLREIMDGLSSHSPAEFIVVMKGAQLGFTEAGNNWVGYVIDHNPGPMLMVKPTLDMARMESRQRIKPMIEESPRLSSRVRDARTGGHGDTVLKKEFPDGILSLVGAHSAAALRQMPARDLFFDEADGAPDTVDTKEADPLSMAIARTRGFRRSRTVYIPSTPASEVTSRIVPWFERGDKRYYEVPCPHCGVYQKLEWKQVKWDHEIIDGEKVHHTETVRYICNACKESIHEHHKTAMLAAGVWTPTVKPRDPRVRSYHINALYSPVGKYTWQDAALDLIEAKLEAKRGNILPLMEWTNTVLAEPWREKRKELKKSVLYSRREDYPAQVPAGAVLLVAGADVHPDRIEFEVVGYSTRYESWGIAYYVLMGDTNEQDVWDQLDIELAGTYKHESGALLGISASMIDAGYRTTRVWEFCKTRWSRKIWCGQGKAGAGMPYASEPKKKRTGRHRRPVRQFMLGVDSIKSLLMSRLHITQRGPGYCHFPISEDYGEDYFAQLTAEKLFDRYSKGRKIEVWEKVRERNEAWDCRVYSIAALFILGQPALKAAARRLAALMGKTEGDQPKTDARSRRRRRSSWATGWKK